MGMEFDPSKLLINMQAIRAKIAKDGQRKAVVAGARVIGAAMTERAPVLDAKTVGSDSLDPGEIKANVKVRTRQIDGETVALVGPKGKDGQVSKIAYNVEYGHRMVVGGKSKLGPDGVFRGEGSVVGDVPPYPFLRPAFEASAEGAIEAVGVELGKQMKDAVNHV